MSYSEYVPKHERPVISALLKRALNDGHNISVFEGENYAIKRSSSLNAIRAALGSSGEDTLLIRNSAGDKLGHFYLIYDNGSEGDPIMVIADYSANDYCEGLYRPLYDRYS